MAPGKNMRGRAGMGSASPSLFQPPASSQPLAARMRPASLDEFVGQEQLLAPGMALRESIERGKVTSMLFWGPPGSGKTTLALLIANYTEREFVPFSAVTEGVPRVREIIAAAEERLAMSGRGTVLFVDEIHRLNRAQQDAFLPHVERGTVTLIGATTENPSFEINGALLSRTRVFVLKALTPSREGDANGVGALWARAKIASLMDEMTRGADSASIRPQVVKVALDHHLVSAYTSLVAVDVSISNASGSAKTALVKVSAPQGWGGEIPQTDTPATLQLLLGFIALASAGIVAAVGRTVWARSVA